MDLSLVPQHLQALGLPSPVHTASSHKLAEAAPQTKEFTTELQPQRAHLPVSSMNKEKIFGDHNTLITLQKLSLQLS